MSANDSADGPQGPSDPQDFTFYWDELTTRQDDYENKMTEKFAALTELIERVTNIFLLVSSLVG